MKILRKIMVAFAIACIVLAGCGSKAQQAVETAAEHPVEAATEKAAEEAAEAAAEKAVEAATEKAVEAATEKTSEPAAEEAVESAPEEAVEPAPEEDFEPAPGEALDADSDQALESLAEAAGQRQDAKEEDSGWNDPDKTKIDLEKQEIIYADGTVIRYEIKGKETTFTMGEKSLTVTGHPEGDPSSDGNWKEFFHKARLIIK